VSPARLEFTGTIPLDDFLALYHHIDLALDPFPYGGGTTTCDALWMGVPVVTLSGGMAVGRGSTSVLTNLRIPQLIAPSTETYIQTAVSLAQDNDCRAALRASLRNRMKASPLMDTRGFMEGLERAYRAMWREWCERPNRSEQ